MPKPLPPDFEEMLAQQVQATRRPAPSSQPLVIHIAQGANLTLVLGGTAHTTVLQPKA